MLAQQIFNGLLLGSTYALFALGLNLVLGALNLLNFAHGEALMVAVYAVLMLQGAAHVSGAVLVLAAMAAAAAVSMGTYLFAFRWVNKEYWMAGALSTIGISIFAQTLGARLWGTDQRQVPDIIRGTAVTLGPVTATGAQLLLVAVTVLLMVSLHVLLTRTRAGRGMRALAENRTTAMLMGVNVERMIQGTFLVAGILAGAAGVLLTSVYNTVTPFVGLNLSVKGITAITIGGMGNTYGAIVAGLLIGVLETLTVAYGSASYRDALVFALLVLILMVRPQGLLGVRFPERA